MKTQDNSNTAQSIARDISTLERLYAFNGESIAKAGDVTTEESIRLGVALISRGEENKARGVFVLAAKAAKLTAEELKTFRDSLKSEMLNEAKQRTVALLGANVGAKELEKAKNAAADEAGRRFDNLGQTLRAAQWMLANPRKVADGVSVFTVQQANAYLEAPKTKEGEVADPVKLALHDKVSALLKKPGTSQGAIKEAVKAVKDKAAEDAEKAKAASDKRTPEQKANDAREMQVRSLCSKVLTAAADWEALCAAGMSPLELRRVSISPADVSKGSLADAVKSLAKLAGLEVK